ncbi:MAG: phosphoribosylpyrophosphate synthetase [Ferruginibacter sp.]
MESFETVTEALQYLRNNGYTLDFNLANDRISCPENDIHLHPGDFEIMAVYRFEGETNPGDEDVVYAIASKDGKTRGTLTSAFGIYADSVSAEMVKKLSAHSG